MAEPSISPDHPPGTFFELERFERTDDDRLALSGRWFGVRGRRFVRPTLTLRQGEGEIRALADLEHKPWEPREGEDWQAAFTCQATDVADAHLAVAPDIAVWLPAPGANGTRPLRLEAAGAVQVSGGRRGTPRVQDAGSASRPSAPALRRELQESRERLEQAERALADTRGELEQAAARANAELEQAAARANAELEQAAARANAELERARASGERASQESRRLRHRLQRAEQELQRISAERDEVKAALLRRDARVHELQAILQAQSEARDVHPDPPGRPGDGRGARRGDPSPVPSRPVWVVWIQRLVALAFLVVPVVAVLVLAKLI